MFRPDRRALAYLSGLFFCAVWFERAACREGRFLRGLPAGRCRCLLAAVYWALPAGRSVYCFLLPFAFLFWRHLEHFNFEMLRWLRKQTPAVEA